MKKVIFHLTNNEQMMVYFLHESKVKLKDIFGALVCLTGASTDLAYSAVDENGDLRLETVPDWEEFFMESDEAPRMEVLDIDPANANGKAEVN